eukprot:UN0926
MITSARCSLLCLARACMHRSSAATAASLRHARPCAMRRRRSDFFSSARADANSSSPFNQGRWRAQAVLATGSDDISVVARARLRASMRSYEAQESRSTLSHVQGALAGAAPARPAAPPDRPHTVA